MKRVLTGLAIVLVVYFAVQGGEYSTVDLVRQRTQEQRLRSTIDSLRRDVDSLTRLRKRLATDPVLQERVAREENGMVRSDKELVYRFEESARDSAGVRR